MFIYCLSFILSAILCVCPLEAATLGSHISSNVEGRNIFKSIANNVLQNSIIPAVNEQVANRDAALLAQEQAQELQRQKAAEMELVKQKIEEKNITMPVVDIDASRKIDSKLKFLERQIILQKKTAENILKKYGKINNFVNHLNSKGVGYAGVTKSTSKISTNSENYISGNVSNSTDLEAPIVFVQLPLLDSADEFLAEDDVTCEMQRIADVDSPVVKMLDDYELEKLKRTEGGSLSEVQVQIEETNDKINQFKAKREELLNKLKAKTRNYAKKPTKTLKADVEFANRDLIRKDKEIRILGDKLKELKQLKNHLIKNKVPERAEKDQSKNEDMEEDDEEESD